MRVTLFALAGWLLVSCHTSPSTTTVSQLGKVTFQFTAGPEALPLVEEGWLLLHSFEYEDARTAFRAAQAADPLCPMAYWGEAMSHHYTLWEREDTEAGRIALAKWREASNPETSITKVEQGLIEAAEVLYGSGSAAERNQAFAFEMGKLYQRFPQDLEVASLYALSLLGSVAEGRDYVLHAQAAAISQQILQQNPKHPGALHYLIHAFDDPEHAHLALDAAYAYATVASDAAHALHMPSHIFVARGMWDEVINSNIASYGASVDRMERLGMNHNARSYHSFAWLLYGLLQQGRMSEVERIMDDMMLYVAEKPSVPARSYLIGMKGSYLAHVGQWDSAFRDLIVDDQDLDLSLQSIQAFIQGMIAYQNQDRSYLEQTILSLEKARIRATNSLVASAEAACSAFGAPAITGNTDIKVAQVMEMELKAMLADLQGNASTANQWFEKACALEAVTDYEYGPPTIIKPAHELYADWLLAQGRAEDALLHYGLAEQRTPKRWLVLEGQLKAHQLLKNQAAADSLTALMQDIRQPLHPEITYVSR